MPMVGMAISRGDLGGQRLGHAFEHDGEGAGFGHGLGVGFDGGPFGFGAALRLEAAQTWIICGVSPIWPMTGMPRWDR